MADPPSWDRARTGSLTLFGSDRVVAADQVPPTRVATDRLPTGAEAVPALTTWTDRAVPLDALIASCGAGSIVYVPTAAVPAWRTGAGSSFGWTVGPPEVGGGMNLPVAVDGGSVRKMPCWSVSTTLPKSLL